MQICQYLFTYQRSKGPFRIQLHIIQTKKKRFCCNKEGTAPFRTVPYSFNYNQQGFSRVILVPVDGSCSQLLFNTEQLVVLGDPVGTAQ
jgi:hypothetical protein